MAVAQPTLIDRLNFALEQPGYSLISTAINSLERMGEYAAEVVGLLNEKSQNILALYLHKFSEPAQIVVGKALFHSEFATVKATLLKQFSETAGSPFTAAAEIAIGKEMIAAGDIKDKLSLIDDLHRFKPKAQQELGVLLAADENPWVKSLLAKKLGYLAAEAQWAVAKVLGLRWVRRPANILAKLVAAQAIQAGRRLMGREPT